MLAISSGFIMVMVASMIPSMFTHFLPHLGMKGWVAPLIEFESYMFGIDIGLFSMLLFVSVIYFVWEIIINVLTWLRSKQLKVEQVPAIPQSTYLDICTSHVSMETMEWLGKATPGQLTCPGITVAPYKYGVFVSVPGESANIMKLKCADDLKAVLLFGRTKGCDVVRFDADAPSITELPVFEWS